MFVFFLGIHGVQLKTPYLDLNPIFVRQVIRINTRRFFFNDSRARGGYHLSIQKFIYLFKSLGIYSKVEWLGKS